MEERSRVKFNPVTKEIEIEGSEKFVKTYFNKLQAIFSGTQKTVAKAPVITKTIKAIKKKPVKKAIKVKKASRAIKKEKPTKGLKRVSKSNSVLALIKDSPEGITTTGLKEKTGLMAKQIWAIIANAKKTGKIKQVKRGLYISA